MGLPGDPGARAARCPATRSPRRWFREEYEPVVEMLDEAELIPAADRHRGLHARRAAALPAPAHARVGRRGHRARSAGSSSTPPRDDDTMVRRLRRELRRSRLVAARGRAHGRPGLASTIRLRPSSGSKSCSFARVHPQLGLLALLDLAGGVEPRHDAALAALHRDLAAAGVLRPARAAPRDSIRSSDSTVKCAYSSEPSDSSTSIFALKSCRGRAPRRSSVPSSKFSGRMPAISWRPSASRTRVVQLAGEPHVAERQLHRVALDRRRHEVHRRRADEARPRTG